MFGKRKNQLLKNEISILAARLNEKATESLMYEKRSRDYQEFNKRLTNEVERLKGLLKETKGKLRMEQWQVIEEREKGNYIYTVVGNVVWGTDGKSYLFDKDWEIEGPSSAKVLVPMSHKNPDQEAKRLAGYRGKERNGVKAIRWTL